MEEDMSKGRVLVIDDDQNILDIIEMGFQDEGLKCEKFNPRTSDPFFHELLIHDCGIDGAPCNRLTGVISDYDYGLRDDCNGLTVLKLFRDSNCKKSQTMPLVLISAGFSTEEDMSEIDQDLTEYQIEFQAKPFSIKDLVTALKIPL
jgi:DNA-binding NtrC family response regulator